ncbi:MAG TPA: hypothetical protein VMR43_03640 [Variovorax sp.]|nr:hypothetical protein [Variovorax sp.]
MRTTGFRVTKGILPDPEMNYMNAIADVFARPGQVDANRRLFIAMALPRAEAAGAA